MGNKLTRRFLRRNLSGCRGPEFLTRMFASSEARKEQPIGTVTDVRSTPTGLVADAKAFIEEVHQ